MSGKFDGEAIARQRIAAEADARTGFLDLGGLGLTALPPELFQLRHLRELNLGADMVRQDGNYHQAYDPFGDNHYHNYIPTKYFEALRRLPDLVGLSVSGTQVDDLTPLSGLQTLQSLDCSNTSVADLTPLSGLPALRSLDCSHTPVADLTPLANVALLQGLDCSATAIADLAPLSKLTKLEVLDCAYTEVSDLSPLQHQTRLTKLTCSYTQISDIEPLKSMAALVEFAASQTKVSDISPLAQLPSLQTLGLSFCNLTRVPDGFWLKPSLTTLYLLGSRIPNVPAEVLSQSRGDNCLGPLRAHLLDLRSGGNTNTDYKLIVLGNGRVGKTQICGRLRSEDYDPAEPSTHGIRVTSAPLGEGEDSIRLNIWDFGGQDLYHGTHALFLRTSAIFLMVWAEETEDASEHEYVGTTYRNQPLPYWLAYVRHLAGTASPLLIVQTRCDRPRDEALRPPLSDEDIAGFEFHPVLHYSALNDRGRDRLDGALHEAVDWLREHQGTAQIGIGRMRVQRALQALRDADSKLPPEERQHRTISQAHFHRLCADAGNISSPDALLRYLHNAGIVFHRPGLFGDSIVLDQGWALDAIYAVLNRANWRVLTGQSPGRFTRPLLELLVWRKHPIAEQKLFLDMMRSCGVCFVHRQGPDRDDDTTEYIAPDLLPQRNLVQGQLNAQWDAEQPTETAEFEFELLHPGFVRGLICEIGSEAGVAALYWLGGVCLYDRDTRSHALIEQHMHDALRGSIKVQTQHGQARLLLDRLSEWIERRSGRNDLSTTRIGDPGPRRISAGDASSPTARPATEDRPPVSPGPAPVPETEYYVSFAWADITMPEAREHGAIVNRLCAAAKSRGIRILRDNEILKFGERITPFMRRIGKGDRVFVILSEKYLQSPYCMFELCEIWRYSRGDEADFCRPVCIYTLPGTPGKSPIERMHHAGYWKKQYDELKEAIEKYGVDTVGEQDFAQFKLMGDFYRHVGNILYTMFDTIQPRRFEDLVQYGLQDAPPT